MIFFKIICRSLPLATVGHNAASLIGEDAIDFSRVRNVLDEQLSRIRSRSLHRDIAIAEDTFENRARILRILDVRKADLYD